MLGAGGPIFPKLCQTKTSKNTPQFSAPECWRTWDGHCWSWKSAKFQPHELCHVPLGMVMPPGILDTLVNIPTIGIDHLPPMDKQPPPFWLWLLRCTKLTSRRSYRWLQGKGSWCFARLELLAELVANLEMNHIESQNGKKSQFHHSFWTINAYILNSHKCKSLQMFATVQG